MSEGQGIRVTAVVVGFLADVIGTIALGAVVGVVLVAQGTPPHRIAERMWEPTGLALGLVLGMMGTAFGGFIAGSMAGRSAVFHGGLVGALGVVLSLLFASHYPMWYNAACLGGGVPVAMFGGWLAASPPRDAYARERYRGYGGRDAGW